MNPMNAFLAQTVIDDHLARAARHRRARAARRDDPAPRYDCVTIRRAVSGDRPALERLAQLEGRSHPAGSALVAEVGGRVLAARWLEAGQTVADPFEPTAELVALLGARAAHLGYRPRAVTRPFRRAARRVAALARHQP